MSGVPRARFVGATLAALLLLATAPGARAFEFFDGRVQVHGFYEAQVRSMMRDFDQNDGWDLTQWYNVLNIEVDWDVGLLETLTVYSASKRMEKIVDAPAAITVIPEQQIEMEASTGQVPKLLEFTPGAEITQSGIYAFNVNTRGFNSSVNRRVATYLR